MDKNWWKEAVIYQIYPRSFKDSNGDGIGDLRGIIEKLDYLAELGVDVLWLSPIFQSPNDDNGYDISDYCAIMDEFGTMADFDELLMEAHRRGLKIILDLVVNHSSDEHPWFRESRKSTDNPYRDYYFWKAEKPNNWQSFFGGDAWQYDERTGEYYLHLFTKKQPDLNWEHPKLRQEVYNLMRFWLDKGVDGFRMDVIPLISKRLDFPDIDPANMLQSIYEIYANGPRLHEFLKEMNVEVSSHYDLMTVGEGIGVTTDNCLLYVDPERKELNMLYHFDHMFLDHGAGGRFDPKEWKLQEFKKVFLQWHEALGKKGWINVFLDNHDFPRMLSRFGNDSDYRVESAKLFATLLLTLRGTPCIYQGSEIGMTNVAFDSFEDYRDVEMINALHLWKEKKKDLNTLLKAVHKNGRDNARTPIQWNDSPNAGFTSGKPWIKVNPNYPDINVANALVDPDSIFHYYQQLLKLRKKHPTLIYGDFEVFNDEDERLFVYRRIDEFGSYLIFLNFSSKTVDIQDFENQNPKHFLVGNYKQTHENQWTLKPWEARIYVEREKSERVRG